MATLCCIDDMSMNSGYLGDSLKFTFDKLPNRVIHGDFEYFDSKEVLDIDKKLKLMLQKYFAYAELNDVNAQAFYEVLEDFVPYNEDLGMSICNDIAFLVLKSLGSFPDDFLNKFKQNSENGVYVIKAKHSYLNLPSSFQNSGEGACFACEFNRVYLKHEKQNKRILEQIQVDFDGDTILFSYKPNGDGNYFDWITQVSHKKNDGKW